MKFLLGDGDREIDIATPVVVRSHQSSCPGCEDIYAYWVEDADGKAIQDGCNGLYEGDEQEIMAFALNELAQLRAERDALKARVDTRDALINVMAPMHQLTCRNHKTCPICKAYDKYSKEIDGESVDTTPGGDE